MTLRSSNRKRTAVGSDKENKDIASGSTASIVEGEGEGARRKRKTRKGGAIAKSRKRKKAEQVAGMALERVRLVKLGSEIVDDAQGPQYPFGQKREETAITANEGGGGGEEGSECLAPSIAAPVTLLPCASSGDKSTSVDPYTDAISCFESPRLQSHVTEEAGEGGEEGRTMQEHVAGCEDGGNQEPYLSENTLLGSHYRIRRILGHGNFSTTYLAEEVPTEPEPPDLRRKTVAIKRLKQPYSSIGENEFSLLEFLHSQGGEKPRHIISPITYFFSETDHFHLVLEALDSARPVSLPACACLSQDVHSKLACPHRHLSLAKILVQLLSGLLSLHSHKLIHADLTPANVLFLPTSNRIKIIDFGNAIRPEDREAYLNDFDVQSACYRAPEVLLGSGPLSRVMDVWSAGVIAVEILLDGEVVGEGLEARELMRSRVQGREALVRRTVELVGSVREYAGGMYYTDVYDDISLEPIVFTPRKRKRKGSRGRSVDETRLGRKGILRTFLDEATRNVGMVDFLMDMMEVGVRRRKAVTGMLKHPWLIRQLLGDWGILLTGGVDDEGLRSDVVGGVEDQLELDSLREDGDEVDGLPILTGQPDVRLEQLLGADGGGDVQEPSPNELQTELLPPPAECPPSPSRSPSPYRALSPYRSLWEDISDSPLPKDRLQLDEVKRERSSSPLDFNFGEEDVNSLNDPGGEETDNSAPETSLITNDDTTNMTLGENLFSSPPSSPPLPTPPLQEDNSIKTSDSHSPSPVAFVGRIAEPESLFDKNEEDAAATRRASDAWHRDLAADMDDLSEEADDNDDQVMLC